MVFDSPGFRQSSGVQPFMKKGDMIEVLHDVEVKLPRLLTQPDSWNTLDVNYEPPRVERLWYQLGEYRVYLHRIHPCETPLFHTHPWPSAVHILSGRYEMGIGSYSDSFPISTVTLTAGSEYEMIDKFGMHSVMPIAVASLSVMVTGKPWTWLGTDPSPQPSTKLNPLTDDAKHDMLRIFRQFFCH